MQRIADKNVNVDGVKNQVEECTKLFLTSSMYTTHRTAVVSPPLWCYRTISSIHFIRRLVLTACRIVDLS